MTRRPAGGWLLREPDMAAALRLFCLPHAGVGASAFHAWPRWLGPVEVCPVQFPGRENRLRDAHFGSYERLAAELADYLGPFLDRPVLVFGHCSGALPAFELAGLLAEAGRAPVRLIVSGQPAPHEQTDDRLLGMTDDQLRAELEAQVLAKGEIAAAPLIDLSLRVLKADLVAHARYHRPTVRRVPFPITVVRWVRDVYVTQADVAGWSSCADEVTEVVVDGTPGDIVAPPEVLLKLLSFSAGVDIDA